MLGKASEIKTLRVTEKEHEFDWHMDTALKGLGDAEILQIQTHVYENNDFPNYHFMEALIIYKEASQ